MDTDEFRRRGKQMVDYIADYLDNIKSAPFCIKRSLKKFYNPF
jgi:hypothetical protein